MPCISPLSLPCPCCCTGCRHVSCQAGPAPLTTLPMLGDSHRPNPTLLWAGSCSVPPPTCQLQAHREPALQQVGALAILTAGIRQQQLHLLAECTPASA